MADKFYQSIGQVCKITGLDRSTIYVWEKEIPNLKPFRSSGGHRYYNNDQVELLLYVKRLRYDEGYNFEGVRKRLSMEKQQEKPPIDAHPIESISAVQTAFSSEEDTSYEPEKLLHYLKSGLKEILSILQKR